MFDEIINPLTGRKVKTNGRLGRKILNKYVNVFSESENIQNVSLIIQEKLDAQDNLENYIKIAKLNQLHFQTIKRDFINKTIKHYLKKKKINIELPEMDLTFSTLNFYLSKSLHTSFPYLTIEELLEKLIPDISSRLDLEISYFNYKSA